MNAGLNLQVFLVMLYYRRRITLHVLLVLQYGRN